MKAQYLIRLLSHPHKITPEDIANLQDLVQQYPYFQVVYALLAKVAYDQDHTTAQKPTQLAAIYATSRSHLKALLEGAPPFNHPTPVAQEPQNALEEKPIQADGHDFINGYINAIRQRGKQPITKQTSLTQLHIIQDFMQKEVRFKPQPLPVVLDQDYQRDLTQKSTAFHDDLATESLAQVLVQQGKIARALDIYTQLLLKFPEKKAYFADLIEKLKSQY